MGKKFTVSDGKLMLILEVAEEGGYIVTSPLDPEVVTEAGSLEEVFEMARDALKGLRKTRARTKQLENDFERWTRQIEIDSRNKRSPIMKLASRALREHRRGLTKTI